MSSSKRPVSIALACLFTALSAPLVFMQQRDSAGSEARLQQARSLFDQGKFVEAAAEARRARQLDPRNAAAWKLSGLALQLARRLPEAEEEFSGALRIFPKDADLWFYLGRVRYLNHSLKQGEDAVRKALSLQPSHADAHTQLGMVLEAQHDDERALESYRAAVELNRGQSRAETMPLVNSSRLLLRLGRLDESLRAAAAAVTLNPRSASIRVLRGRILERMGHREEAARDYHEAIQSGDPTARNLLARLQSGATVPAGTGASAPSEGAPAFRFQNEAPRAKLTFTLRNSASPRKYQVETMTGGVAVLDYDGDGWQDVYFVNGAGLPSMRKTSAQYWNRLFRNTRDGMFMDVTAKAGVAGEGYSMGVAAGDYDNDGDPDLFVAGVNRNILFQNRGDGTFADVTVPARLEGVDPVRGKMWSVAAAWIDYDNDGRLDLFVANYCKWSPSLDPYCGAALPGHRTYCFPDRYEGLPNQLFRNNGDGTFADVSAASGIAAHVGKGMGVVVADYDDDGDSDIFVANDTVPNFLFRNAGNGTFQEAALNAGVALPESGEPVSSMGVDFRDYNNDGLPDLIVSALEGETFPLFRNLGKGFFSDETYASGLGPETARRSGWSLGFFDLDNDGLKDLFSVNSHVNDNIELFNEQTYRQAPSLFANAGKGVFRPATLTDSADLQVRAARRGCAFADFNNDGAMDVVTTALNEPAELFVNRTQSANHWLLVKLVGAQSNRQGLGAKIRIVTAQGAQFNHATTSVGYGSSSDARVHFGLGPEKVIRELEVRWPGGTVQTLRNVAADQVLTIEESSRDRRATGKAAASTLAAYRHTYCEWLIRGSFFRKEGVQLLRAVNNAQNLDALACGAVED